MVVFEWRRWDGVWECWHNQSERGCRLAGGDIGARVVEKVVRNGQFGVGEGDVSVRRCGRRQVCRSETEEVGVSDTDWLFIIYLYRAATVSELETRTCLYCF